ncbi:hypothetical protein [Mycoplasma sp. Z1473D]
MNNHAVFNPNDYPTTESFYEKFKEKFNLWTWIWISGLILCLALLIADLVLKIVFQSDFVNYGYYREDAWPKDHPTEAEKSYFLSIFFYRIFWIVVFILAFGYLIYSVITYRINSKTQKSFINNSQTMWFVALFIAMWEVFQLIEYMVNSELNKYAGFAIAGFVLELVLSITYLVVYFVPTGQVKKIQKFNIFVNQNIQFKEWQKNYQKMYKDGNGPLDIFGIFNQIVPDTNSASSDSSATEEDNNMAQSYQEGENENKKTSSGASQAAYSDPQKAAAMEKLLSKPNSQLFQMAAILNISGYEDMSKEELASLIYNYTKQAQERYQQVKKQEDIEEAQVVEDNTDKK